MSWISRQAARISNAVSDAYNSAAAVFTPTDHDQHQAPQQPAPQTPQHTSITDKLLKTAQYVNHERENLGEKIGDKLLHHADKAKSDSHNYQEVLSLSEAIKQSAGNKCSITPQEVVTCAKLSESIYDPKKTEHIADIMKFDKSDPSRYTITPISKDGKNPDVVVIMDNKTHEATVVFKGTKTLEDIKKDAKAHPVTLDNGPERVHSGFKQHAEENWPKIQEALKGAKQVDFTGHSLGGAAAQIAAVKFHKECPNCPLKVVTCGSPRVGNHAFAEALNEATQGNAIRVVHASDPVAEIPPKIPGVYEHATRAIVIDNNKLLVSNKPDTASMGTVIAGAAKAAIDGAADHGTKHYGTELEARLASDTLKLQEALTKIQIPLSAAIGTAATASNSQAQIVGTGNQQDVANHR